VTITGTRTTATYSNGADAKTTYDATAALTVRPDRVQPPVRLTISEDFFGKSKTTLKLTEDGRLSGTDVAWTGEGSKIIGAIANLAGVVAKVAPLAYAAEDAPPEQAFPHQQLLDDLAAKEDELAGELAALDISATGAKARLDLITDALRSIAAQRDRLTAEQTSWAAADETTTETHAYVLDLAELPTEEQLAAGLDDHPTAKQVWEALHVMATVPAYHLGSDPHAEYGEDDAAPFQQGADRQIWYRRPRPCVLSVWKKGEDDAEPQLVQRLPAEVVDKHCRHFGLVMDEHGLFNTTELDVTMGTLGTPTSISTNHDSGAADAISAIAGAPSQFLSGYAAMGKVQAGLAGTDPAEAKIAALKTEKETLQLQADIAKLKKGQPAATK